MWGVSMAKIVFFNDTATTEIYTLSLHDALPIYPHQAQVVGQNHQRHQGERCHEAGAKEDRKSTRLNSSHSQISYAVFCLKKINGGEIPSEPHFRACIHSPDHIYDLQSHLISTVC